MWRWYVTSVSHKMSFKEWFYLLRPHPLKISNTCCFSLLYRTLNIFHFLASNRLIKITLRLFSSIICLSSRFCLLLLIFFPTLHFPSHTPQKKLFFAPKKMRKFFIFSCTRTFFYKHNEFFLERQLHSGCVRNEIKNHPSKKRVKRKFFAARLYAHKKSIKRDHDLLYKKDSCEIDWSDSSGIESIIACDDNVVRRRTDQLIDVIKRMGFLRWFFDEEINFENVENF